MKRRTHSGLVVRRIFEILLDHPEGLSTKDLYDRFVANGDLSGEFASLERLSFERACSGCVAAIKGGWLHVSRDQWILSDEGRRAYTRFKDPETFMIEAGRLSLRGWLSVNLPRLYFLAGKTKDQFTSEYRAARRIGMRRLFKETFGRTTPWQEVLPLQTPPRVIIPDAEATTGGSLLETLTSLGVSYREGGHAVYVPPQDFAQSALNILARRYPGNAGIKIAKNQGGVDESSYITKRAKGDSLIAQSLTHGHRQLTLVANLLHSVGLGPRLYDLVEMQIGKTLWTAYVIEHINGGVPSMAQCEAGIERIRQLNDRGVLKITSRDGFDDEEFECPACGNNALVDHNGEFRYVDFQNFFLGNYESFLTGIAVEASDKSHFGDRSVLRGGRYLYQSVPGVRLPGKRSAEDRIEVLSRMVASVELSLKDRLVLDIGCNIGMMMAQYLKLGAHWCHGWDRAYLTPHTERLLLALGCTRFSTSGTDIDKSRPIEDDLPQFLRDFLNGCVISYLAVRAHLGWLDAFARLPWSFMIYEGHEGETNQDFDEHMEQFRKLTNFDVRAIENYIDGDSNQRIVAILVRTA